MTVTGVLDNGYTLCDRKHRMLYLRTIPIKPDSLVFSKLIESQQHSREGGDSNKAEFSKKMMIYLSL